MELVEVLDRCLLLLVMAVLMLLVGLCWYLLAYLSVALAETFSCRVARVYPCCPVVQLWQRVVLPWEVVDLSSWKVALELMRRAAFCLCQVHRLPPVLLVAVSRCHQVKLHPVRPGLL
jgi:hypothetical protein